MAKTKYSIPNITSDMVTAYGRDLSISTKSSINICNTLRGMPAQKAVKKLDAVIARKEAIAFTRFTDGVGHRKGPLAAGRFPVKAAKEIQMVIKSAIANAANQGLATDLKLVHICAHKAATPFHQGRQRRRAMKRTHIEVALKEMALPVTKSKAKAKPAAKKEEAPKKIEQTEKTVAPKATPQSKEKKTVSEEKKTVEVQQ